MKKVVLFVFLIGLLVATAFFFVKLLPGPANQTNDLGPTRVNEEASVTVSTTFVTPQQPQADGWLTFEVSFNTHSVSLSTYDIVRLAVLKVNPGKGEYTDFVWEEEGTPQDHHRGGLLKIRNDSLVTSKTKSITLEIREIGGVPARIFKWDRDSSWTF